MLNTGELLYRCFGWVGLPVCLLACLVAWWRLPPVEPASFDVPATPDVKIAPPKFYTQFLPVPESWQKRRYSAHAATLAVLPNGNIAAAWFAGSREGAADVGIWFSIRDAQGWAPPVAVLSRTGLQDVMARTIRKLGNPVLFYDVASQRLYLFVVSVSIGGWAGSAVNYLSSGDAGQSWSRPKRLITSPFFNLSTLVRTPPLRLTDGSLGLPAYHELGAKFGLWLRLRPETGHWPESERLRFLELSRIPEPRRSLQPAVAALGAQRALALLRDSGGGEGKIRAAASDDTGSTWRDTPDPPLGNPDASVALLRLNSGDLLLAANPGSGRQELTLWHSGDSGSSWRRARVVESSERGEYSYPSLAQSGDGDIHLAYTWRRQGIRYARFNKAWLRGGQTEGQTEGRVETKALAVP